MRKPVFYAGRTEISVIKFDDIQVRIVSINGEPWFVGADVCAALEISNPPGLEIPGEDAQRPTQQRQYRRRRSGGI